MRLVWTLEALEDRRAVFDYIEADNPSAALALDERLSIKATRLTDFPQLGHPGRVKGTRELTVHRHYLLVYDFAEDTVRVLRVLHSARQWPPEQC